MRKINYIEDKNIH